MRPVTVGDVVHGRKYLVSGMCERLCRVAAEAAAGSCNKDAFRHGDFLLNDSGLTRAGMTDAGKFGLFRFRQRRQRCPSDPAPCSAVPRLCSASHPWRSSRTCESNGRKTLSRLATISRQSQARSATPTRRHCGPHCAGGSPWGAGTSCGNALVVHAAR